MKKYTVVVKNSFSLWTLVAVSIVIDLCLLWPVAFWLSTTLGFIWGVISILKCLLVIALWLMTAIGILEVTDYDEYYGSEKCPSIHSEEM